MNLNLHATESRPYDLPPLRVENASNDVSSLDLWMLLDEYPWEIVGITRFSTEKPRH